MYFTLPFASLPPSCFINAICSVSVETVIFFLFYSRVVGRNDYFAVRSSCEDRGEIFSYDAQAYAHMIHARWRFYTELILSIVRGIYFYALGPNSLFIIVPRARPTWQRSIEETRPAVQINNRGTSTQYYMRLA